MKPEMKKLYREIYEFYLVKLGQLKKFMDDCADNDMYELADRAYALREIEKLLDSLRKTALRSKERSEQIACVLWAKDSDGDPIRTQYCTATPDVKQMSSIPKLSTNREEYLRMMDYLGVPREVAEQDIVRPHWPSWVKFLSSLAEQGKPLPPGVDPEKTYPVYRLICRSKKDILEEEEG